MNDLNTIVSINEKAGATLTIKELVKQLKGIFTLDDVDSIDSIYNNLLSIKAGQNQDCFTNTELLRLYDLAKKYNFSFSVHNSYNTLSILLKLEDSYIIF